MIFLCDFKFPKIPPIKFFHLLIIINFLYINICLSILIPGRNNFNSLNQFAFINNLKIIHKNILPLFSGWGITDKYSWEETDNFVYITSPLKDDIKSNELSVDLNPNSIKIFNNTTGNALIDGITKGRIDVEESYWTLERKDEALQLQITLKKKHDFNQYWYGVLNNETTQLKEYTNPQEYSGDSDSIAGFTSVKSNEVYDKRYFKTISAAKLGELFEEWVGRYADDLVPFGKPKTQIEFTYQKDNSTNKLLFTGLNTPDYINIIIKPLDTTDTKSINTDDNNPVNTTDSNPLDTTLNQINIKEGSEIIFMNGPTTEILSGSQGDEVRRKLITSLNSLINAFEVDINKFLTISEGTCDGFDYASSNAILSPENINQYINYHKSMEQFINQNDNHNAHNNNAVKNDTKVNTGAKVKIGGSVDGSDDKLTGQLMELYETMEKVNKKEPKEQMKSIINNLKKNLNLTNTQLDQLFSECEKRVSREMEELRERKENTTDSDVNIEQTQPSIIEMVEDPFNAIMNNPENKESSLLVRKYHSITKSQQLKLRNRWLKNRGRLEILLNELFNSTPDLFSTICNNYRDLLIGEDYPTLMRSYLMTVGVRNESERERLNYLNKHVLNLVKQAEERTFQDEQFQLAKINQIIQWAINNFDNLNQLVLENKQLYDENFLTYLKLLINRELQSLNPEDLGGPEKNPWLSILTIIEIAIKSMIQTDIEHEIYLITNIVYQKVPKVRKHMIEFILATMPRSDWKFFKHLVNSITQAFDNIPPEEREMGRVPEWIPEACYQLRNDIESMIPDWIINELLSDNDKLLMRHNDKLRSPIFQLEFPNDENLENGEINEILEKNDKINQNLGKLEKIIKS